MERSWGIVLVLLLISVTSYAQLSSGTIANNRFLQRVNPAIDRALADSGSSLDHPEIQRLARQMVDLGIWDNLVFWAHEGLVKERVSGSDVFVPKSYDITANNNDAANTDTTQQPKLNDGFLFDGTNDRLIVADNDSLTFVSGTNDLPFSVIFWIKVNNNTILNTVVGKSNAIAVGEYYAGAGLFRCVDNSTSSFIAKLRIVGQVVPSSNNTWYMLSCTYNGNKNASGINCYENDYNINSRFSNNTQANYQQMRNTNLQTFIGSRDNSQYVNGEVSDIRVFRNKELSLSEITLIFNETKAKYGY
jgi:hypothetical protein